MGTLEQAGGGNRSGEFIRLDVNYGYDAFTQVSIELPVPYSHPAGEGLQAGVGDVLLEYKRRFGTDPARGYWGINPEVSLPTGDDKRGLGAGRVTLELPLLYQRRWGDTVVYGDLRFKGWAGEDGRSYGFLGGAVEQRFGASLILGAEIFGSTPQAPGGEYGAGFNVGLRYALMPDLLLMGSIGRSFRSDPELTALLGLRLLLPPK